MGTAIRAERKLADGRPHAAAIQWRKFRKRERGRRLHAARLNWLNELKRAGRKLPSLADLVRLVLRHAPAH